MEREVKRGKEERLAYLMTQKRSSYRQMNRTEKNGEHHVETCQKTVQHAPILVRQCSSSCPIQTLVGEGNTNSVWIGAAAAIPGECFHTY